MWFNNSFYYLRPVTSFVHICDWYWGKYGKAAKIGKENINLIEKSHMSFFFLNLKRTDRPNTIL